MSGSAPPRSPVALHEAPGPCHVHGVPRISEPVVLKLDPRLVASRFAVSLDHHTVEPGIAENMRLVSAFGEGNQSRGMGLVSPAQPLKEDMVALGAKFDPSEEAHWGVPPLGLLEHDRVEVLHRDPPEDRPRLKKNKLKKSLKS